VTYRQRAAPCTGSPSTPTGRGFPSAWSFSTIPAVRTSPSTPTDCPNRVAPALAERFEGLGELILRDSWTGLYDQNRFDGNMIMGNWPGHADNFFVACGFSGHGFMHALGVGRGLAELVLHGQYLTVDLSRMGYQRIVDEEYYGEEGVR
jgi:FAD-dependent oxidoreductase domain-containing protein 1